MCSSTDLSDEEKRIRRLYQALLERRPLKYWSILDFPYLAEIVRHDSSYLKRILSFLFIDHPALSHCRSRTFIDMHIIFHNFLINPNCSLWKLDLTLIAWKEMAKVMNSITDGHQFNTMPETLPVGFEKTLWALYKRQQCISDLWSTTAVGSTTKELKCLTFEQFIWKISGAKTK